MSILYHIFSLGFAFPVKESSKRLRTQTSLLPCVNTERFKASFINRLYFKRTFTF